MEGYYVIEFNDKDEKKKILDFVQFETKADAKLTFNLKKFVAEKFNVTVTDNVPMLPPFAPLPLVSEQSSSTTANGAQVDMAPSINHAVNGTPPIIGASRSASEVPTNHSVASPQIDTIKAEPQDINPTPAEPVNVAPVAAPPPNLSNVNRNHDRPTRMHENYQGTYTPVVDTPIVPKVEIIDLSDDEEQEVKPRNMEEQIDGVNDGLNENHVDEAAEVPNVVDTPPSLSRQNRKVAAPKNSVRNVGPQKNVAMANHVDSPTSSRSTNKKVGKRQEDMNTGTNDNAVDDTSMTNQADTPSSSTARKSGRVTKRPNYATIGDENVPGDTNSKRSHVEETEDLDEAEPNTEKCRKCLNEVANQYGSRLDHAMLHTDIGGRYECLVDQCGYTSENGRTLSNHMKLKHPSQPNCYKDFQLNLKQTDELNKVMQECFTDPDNSSDDNCKFCNHYISNRPGSFTLKTEHSYNHLSFMMYKCLESECFFKSKTANSMKGHLRVVHGNQKTPKSTKITHTNKRKSEIDDMVATCFPSLKQD